MSVFCCPCSERLGYFLIEAVNSWQCLIVRLRKLSFLCVCVRVCMRGFMCMHVPYSLIKITDGINASFDEGSTELIRTALGCRKAVEVTSVGVALLIGSLSATERTRSVS